MVKSRRYKAELKKLRRQPEKKVMPKYDQFGVEPGQSTWVDMPEEYKKAFFEWREKEKINASIRHEAAIQRKIEEKTKTKDVKSKRRSPYGNAMGNSMSNFIDNKWFEKRRTGIIPMVSAGKSSIKRKKVLLISDVMGWAWWNKSKYLQMYLADEFDIDIICTVGQNAVRSVRPKKYDVYLTYGYSYVAFLSNVKKEKRITGVTAHRPHKNLQPYMRMAHTLHANSKLLMEDLRKMVNHDRIYYVPNGVDEELFIPIKPIGKNKTLIAGHVGKECPQKKQGEIIIPAIDQAGVDSFYNLNDYTTRVPYCEMYKQYQDMDVFVVASIEDGTPNGALEAAACGRPIISNRIGNMPEFIKDGENGFLVDMDIESYVEKLEYLNENREHLIEMGKNARKTIEEGWTWKIQSENYRKMFDDVLGETR